MKLFLNERNKPPFYMSLVLLLLCMVLSTCLFIKTGCSKPEIFIVMNIPPLFLSVLMAACTMDENNFFFIRDHKKKQEILDIQKVQYWCSTPICADFPTTLTSAFNNVLSLDGVMTKIYFEKLPSASFIISYKDYEALDGKANVEYDEIIDIFGKKVYRILSVTPSI